MEKEREKYRAYGNKLYLLINLLMKTIRIKKEVHEAYREDENYIYAFWHQKIFFPTVSLTKVEKKLVMTSPSKDGEVMAAVLEKYGYEIVRGSSSKESVKSLVTMIRKMREGYSVGFAVDGPRGPAFKIKPGIVYMAKKTGKKIVPVGGVFKKKHVFEKAWDKFQFPYPFTKGAVVMGEPIEVPKDANDEEYMELINKKIDAASERAGVILYE